MSNFQKRNKLLPCLNYRQFKRSKKKEKRKKERKEETDNYNIIGGSMFHLLVCERP